MFQYFSLYAKIWRAYYFSEPYLSTNCGEEHTEKMLKRVTPRNNGIVCLAP